MNWQAKRAEIASVLDGVADIQGKIHRPNTPKVGDAWPHLGGLTRDDNSPAFFVQWNVLVYVPQNEAAAGEWIDNHLEALIDALQQGQVGYVDSAAPANIGVTAHQYGLLITMRGE
jgi:hypothetical protein